ncbi:MAG: hypothetical protein IJ087_01165 [Eggerthellaceae bacterium]|nr:hypothetical protein [Eggerthellaceae bacterium]
MSYPNLEAEMNRYGITAKQIANYLGRGGNTVSAWMNGAEAAFPIMKAKMVRDHFFPNNTLDYLFSEVPLPPEVVTDTPGAVA